MSKTNIKFKQMPSSYKKNKTDFIRENLGGFQDNFTKEQKVAIIECLIIITNSDGEVHPYGMAMVDGILQEKEINYTLGIYNDIGISEKKFEAVKEKTRVIMQKYDF
jgi:hypothetical protein